MNYTKIMTDIVKEWVRVGPGRRTNTVGVGKVPASTDIPYIGFMTDRGAMIRFIPTTECVLDYDQLIKRFEDKPGLCAALVDGWREKPASDGTPRTVGVLSGSMRTLDRGGVAVEFISGSRSAWVNKKLLATFDADATYFMGAEKDAIYVEEGRGLAGIVCPVRINTGERGHQCD